MQIALLQSFVTSERLLQLMPTIDRLLLQWLKSISKIQLLEKEDPVYEWRARIFKVFDGTISKAHTYPV
jgi:hypothetical protein